MKQNDIKNALNEIKPDPYMKVRLEAKVSESTSPKKHRRAFTAGIATALCLAIVAVSMGVGSFTMKTNPIMPNTTQPTQAQSSISKEAPGFVIIAYADENDMIEVKDMNTTTPYICKIGATDVRGMSESQIEKELKNIREKFSTIEGKYENETVFYSTLTHSERFDNAIIYQIYCGEFNFDLPDDLYKDVKEIRVANKNHDYGEMEIRAMDVYYNDNLQRKDDGIDYTKSAYLTNYETDCAILSGERFAKCMELQNDNGSMFGVNWKVGDKLYDEINENPDFDITTVNDTLTFEVEFNDGAISKSVIDISFDSDGNMFATPQAFDYIK